MATLEDDEEFDCDDCDLSCVVYCKCMTCGKEYRTDLVYEDFEYICPECDEDLNKE